MTRSQLNFFPIQIHGTCQNFYEATPVEIPVAFLQAYQRISAKGVGTHGIHRSFPDQWLVPMKDPSTLDNMTCGERFRSRLGVINNAKLWDDEQ